MVPVGTRWLPRNRVSIEGDWDHGFCCGLSHSSAMDVARIWVDMGSSLGSFEAIALLPLCRVAWRGNVESLHVPAEESRDFQASISFELNSFRCRNITYPF